MKALVVSWPHCNCTEWHRASKPHHTQPSEKGPFKWVTPKTTNEKKSSSPNSSKKSYKKSWFSQAKSSFNFQFSSLFFALFLLFLLFPFPFSQVTTVKFGCSSPKPPGGTREEPVQKRRSKRRCSSLKSSQTDPKWEKKKKRRFAPLKKCQNWERKKEEIHLRSMSLCFLFSTISPFICKGVKLLTPLLWLIRFRS